MNVPLGFSEKQTPSWQRATDLGVLAAIAVAVHVAGVTDSDWDMLDRSLADVRGARYDSIHKQPLFEDWDDESDGTTEVT